MTATLSDYVESNRFAMFPRESRVLVVDDDEPIAEALAAVLGEEGYVTEIATNGEEAIGLIRDGWLPDLVLLDVLMPVVNGSHALHALKGDPRTAPIAVVVMSAYHHRLAEVRGLADALLPKPFQTEEVVTLIEQLLVGQAVAV